MRSPASILWPRALGRSASAARSCSPPGVMGHDRQTACRLWSPTPRILRSRLLSSPPRALQLQARDGAGLQGSASRRSCRGVAPFLFSGDPLPPRAAGIGKVVIGAHNLVALLRTRDVRDDNADRCLARPLAHDDRSWAHRLGHGTAPPRPSVLWERSAGCRRPQPPRLPAGPRPSHPPDWPIVATRS